MYVYKNFSTTLDKGLRKNKERERNWKHKLNEIGKLTKFFMKLGEYEGQASSRI